ncbi:MAG TPA: NrfD/PsrC family molybdoenzyme membrane anchor subunit [Ktedonobacterales bacterium]
MSGEMGAGGDMPGYVTRLEQGLVGASGGRPLPPGSGGRPLAAPGQRPSPGRYDRPRAQVLLPSKEAAAMVDVAPETYYGQPMVKRPHWRWYVPVYMFLGGLAGGTALIGTAAQLVGGGRYRTTVRHARYLSVVLAAICPILLILDLGRPRRFLHMLRVIKISSPLNLGTWILTAFGLTSGALAARQAAEDGFVLRRESALGKLARAVPEGPLAVLHALLGIALGGYTGTVLAATAIPLWAAAGVLLGPLFLATSVASGAAALTLLNIFAGGRPAPGAKVRRGVRWTPAVASGPASPSSANERDTLAAVETAAGMAQLGLVVARGALVPKRIDRPLRSGLWGGVFRYGSVAAGMAGPLGIRLGARLAGRRGSTALAATGATLTLLGALGERVALVEAGKRSADDPLAYQVLTAGAPGEARALPAEQARRARRVAGPRRLGIAARDTTPHVR